MKSFLDTPNVQQIEEQAEQYFKDAQAHYGKYALVAGLLWIVASNLKLPKPLVIGGGLYYFWKNRKAIEAKYGAQK